MADLKEQYIMAAGALLFAGSEAEAVAKGLKDTMSRRGHLRLLPKVLDGLAALLARREQMSKPRLTLARESDAARYAAEAKGALVEVDPSLIGGFIRRDGFTETDNSYKTKLLRWYRSVIS